MSENKISAISFLFETRHSKSFVLEYSLKRESLMVFLSESEVVEVGWNWSESLALSLSKAKLKSDKWSNKIGWNRVLTPLMRYHMGVLVVFYYEKNVSLQDTSQKLVIKIRSRYMSKKLTF